MGAASGATKVGIISEGPIDFVLVRALLERIAAVKAKFGWPVNPQEVGDIIPLRGGGHGKVLEAVKRVVKLLDQHPRPDHAFFVIILDRKTSAAQNEIKRLISGNDRFVLGIAIEEIEAWWLGDRTNILSWLRLSSHDVAMLSYGRNGYKAERDPTPKTTLDELTATSPSVDRRYGDGNKDLATDFAEQWRNNAALNDIKSQCPRGFRPFCKATTNAFRRAKARNGKLF